MPDRRPSFRAILVFAVFVGFVAVLGAFKAFQATCPGAHIGVFGDPLVPGSLALPGSGRRLEAQIASGKRAMAVRIDDVARIGDLIPANSRVDVLVTLRTDALSRRQVAKIFMENVRVLFVSRGTVSDADGESIDATTAMLEVAPNEAERLAIAMNQGTIRLVLRGHDDPWSVTTSGANSIDVLAQLRSARTAQLPASDVRSSERRVAPRRGAEPVAAVVQSALAVRPVPAMTPARPDPFVVRVYRGDALVVKKFENVDRAAAAARKP
jgi:pilus assembly protein CpaB